MSKASSKLILAWCRSPVRYICYDDGCGVSISTTRACVKMSYTYVNTKIGRWETLAPVVAADLRVVTTNKSTLKIAKLLSCCDGLPTTAVCLLCILHTSPTQTFARRLTHAVVAQPHIVERHVVLSDALRAVPVEPESILVLPDAIVEPPDLERHVLTRREGGREGGRGQRPSDCEYTKLFCVQSLAHKYTM